MPKHVTIGKITYIHGQGVVTGNGPTLGEADPALQQQPFIQTSEQYLGLAELNAFVGLGDPEIIPPNIMPIPRVGQYKPAADSIFEFHEYDDGEPKSPFEPGIAGYHADTIILDDLSSNELAAGNYSPFRPSKEPAMPNWVYYTCVSICIAGILVCMGFAAHRLAQTINADYQQFIASEQ